jgi:hypothetical protein
MELRDIPNIHTLCNTPLKIRFGSVVRIPTTFVRIRISLSNTSVSGLRGKNFFELKNLSMKLLVKCYVFVQHHGINLHVKTKNCNF